MPVIVIGFFHRQVHDEYKHDGFKHNGYKRDGYKKRPDIKLMPGQDH